MSENKTNNFTRFLRNNVALLLIIFCTLAITAVVVIASVTNNNDTKVVSTTPKAESNTVADDTPQEPVVTIVKKYFASPVAYTGITMEYTNNNDVLFVYNNTLSTWQTHKAVDLSATNNTEVTAMYDGTVIEVSESYGYGKKVVVDHGDNVVATYSSLENVSVVKGQKLSQGEKIGEVGTTASYEFSDGAHLHLEVAVNGTSVDPMPYVNGTVYREVSET